MCKSQRDGGQRCAAHTRPRYESATPGTPEWDEAAAEYASTREGRDRLTEQAARSAAGGDYQTEAALRTALTRGEALRDANTDAAEAIQHADLSTWSPADVDTELARRYDEIQTLRARRDGLAERVNHSIARWVLGRGFRGRASAQEIRDVLAAAEEKPRAERTSLEHSLLQDWAKVEETDAKIDDLTMQMQPYEEEFTRRGGWPRAFLVTNGNGHLHKDMHCSTCRPTTTYYWATEMSGKSEDEIVDAGGERCCSVCYPSAPVEVRNRPTRLFTPDEIAQQAAREQRAAAANQRAADKIAKALTPDGSEFIVDLNAPGERPSRERFKTERAASIWLVDSIAGYRTWRSSSMPEAVKAAHEKVIEAIAVKHNKPVDQVRVDIEKKVEAKVRKFQREAY